MKLIVTLKVKLTRNAAHFSNRGMTNKHACTPNLKKMSSIDVHEKSIKNMIGGLLCLCLITKEWRWNLCLPLAFSSILEEYIVNSFLFCLINYNKTWKQKQLLKIAIMCLIKETVEDCSKTLFWKENYLLKSLTKP